MVGGDGGFHPPYGHGAATVVPKKRRPTRPTKGSVERRIKAKKVRGEVKGLRGRVEE